MERNGQVRIEGTAWMLKGVRTPRGAVTKALINTPRGELVAMWLDRPGLAPIEVSQKYIFTGEVVSRAGRQVLFEPRYVPLAVTAVVAGRSKPTSKLKRAVIVASGVVGCFVVLSLVAAGASSQHTLTPVASHVPPSTAKSAADVSNVSTVQEPVPPPAPVYIPPAPVYVPPTPVYTPPPDPVYSPPPSYYTNVDGNQIESPDANAAGATGVCRDGTYTHAVHHQGACSHHGGVSHWL